MRFSLKWILAGMVYVAIAAAAFTQTGGVYADLLWAVSLLAIVYCITAAIFARGRLQVAAMAFLAGSICFLVILKFGDDAAPMSRFLNVAGVGDANNEWIRSGKLKVADLFSQPPEWFVEIIHARLRAANAVATLAFGLMGSLVGLMAFRASGRDANDV